MNLHIPQAGNVYEAIKLREKFGLGLLEYGASFSAVSWFTISFNIAIALICIGADYLSGGITTRNELIFISIVFLIVLTSPFVLDFALARIKVFNRWKGVVDIQKKVHWMLKTMRNDIFYKEVFLRLVIWSFVLFLAGVAATSVAFQAIGINISFYELIPFVVLNTIMGITNIVPGNLGIGEYAYGFLGTIYDMDLSIGIILALVFRLAVYSVFILVFIIWLLSRMLGIRYE